MDGESTISAQTVIYLDRMLDSLKEPHRALLPFNVGLQFLSISICFNLSGLEIVLPGEMAYKIRSQLHGVLCSELSSLSSDSTSPSLSFSLETRKRKPKQWYSTPLPPKSSLTSLISFLANSK